MDDFEFPFSTGPSDKKTKLVSYAHFEARALKSALLPKEITLLRSFLYKDFDDCRNLYGMFTENKNSDRALRLVKRCAPIFYPFKGVKNITHATESFSQNTICVNMEYDGDYNTVYRLFYTALELLFMRATVEELRSVIAFLVDDTRKLEKFDFETWKFKKLNFVENFEH